MRLFLLLISLLSWARPLSAQYVSVSSQPAWRTQLTKAIDQLYNNRAADAESTFAQLNRQSPGHPVVFLLRAMGQYWQWFPARTDERLRQQMLSQLAQASSRAATWLDRDEGNPEPMFIYFTAEVLAAKLNHFEGETMSAVNHAKNAYPYIRRGRAFHGQFADFYLSSGLYNYYREVYPQLHPFYKSVAWVMESGNKQVGMQQLQQAVRQALFVRTEATLYLTHLLVDYENRPAEALPYLLDLTERYPNNLFFRFKYGEALLNAHRPSDVAPVLAPLLSSPQTTYRQLGKLLQARLALATNQPESAQTLAADVLRSGLKDESARAYAYQVLAQVAQREGQPARAKQYYRQMLSLAEFPVLRRDAQRHL